jgi:homoserine O-acetyltransferase
MTHDFHVSILDRFQGNSNTRVETQSVQLFDKTHTFVLESGRNLAPVSVAYETYGTLNRDGTNAVLICHALTGNAHAAGVDGEGRPGWWDGIIGPGRAFDTTKYFVVASNFLGSCYGSTGPTTPQPETGKPYGRYFPEITVRDMIKLQRSLIDHLGIRHLASVAGGSLGGMQVLEWALMYPDIVDSIIPIATSARHSAWCIGLNEVARQAILNDPAWSDSAGNAQPDRGLALARMIAMISYRSHESFEKRFGRSRSGSNGTSQFEVENYLHYQGTKLVKRFDAATYLTITKAMDSQDVSRGRGTLENALSAIAARTLCVGIDSDILYPASEQRQIAAAIPGAQYSEIQSIHGHDAFLMEYGQLNSIIGNFLSTK